MPREIPPETWKNQKGSVRVYSPAVLLGASNREHPAPFGCGTHKPEVWEWRSSGLQERPVLHRGQLLFEIQGALQDSGCFLNSCLACLARLLSPVAGQMLKTLYPGHYFCSSFARKTEQIRALLHWELEVHSEGDSPHPGELVAEKQNRFTVP